MASLHLDNEKTRTDQVSRSTRYDDEIIKAFEKHFPDYQSDDRLRLLKEDELKSAEGKKRWREFMTDKVFPESMREAIDYNFGTLIRANCEDDYTQENSIFGALESSLACTYARELTCYVSTGYRLQFYAIEIARNRRGLNDKVWEQAQKK